MKMPEIEVPSAGEPSAGELRQGLRDRINRLEAINAELFSACAVALNALAAHDGYTGPQADACLLLREVIAKAKTPSP
jgi:hypothetical protein